MKYFLLFSFLISQSLFAQDQFNSELVSQMSYNENLNDIWGYVAKDSTEYALVGTRGYTSIVSLENPADPKEVSRINGTRSVWRDIKTHGDYAYVVADQGADGLLIINMSTLPDSTTHTFWKNEINVNGFNSTLRTCHNLYIDNGFLYLSGCNIANQGVIILDLNEDPENPKYVGAADLAYSHDVYVKDNLLFASEIGLGRLAIYDISNKSSPELLAAQSTTSRFTHNAWSSDDNKFVFTTDERPNAYIDAYDISNLDQIEKIDRYQVEATQGNGVIPHNTHYHNDFLVTSWYTEGVVIVDASRPHNLVRVAQYDTWQGAHGGFNGCWGAYPYLPSGLVLASDINSGLYVLNMKYKRAAFLEGRVYDRETGNPINGAQIQILTENIVKNNTDAKGDYSAGIVEEGTFKVVVSHEATFPDTIDVQFKSGEVVIQDFHLSELPIRQVNVAVIDKESKFPISNAQILISSESGNTNFISNNEGSIGTELNIGAANLIVGKLGFRTTEINVDIEENADFVVELERGIEDDFVFDYGWKVESTATNGLWERGLPFGTTFDNLKSNPDSDSPSDIGQFAYVTGLTGGEAGDFDVDDGSTNLISPIFNISEISNPQIEYSLWYFNNGGAGSVPNDYIKVFISDGVDTVLVESIKDESPQSGRWRELSKIKVNEYINEPLSEVQIIVIAEDISPGHILEAGFDNFAIVSSTTTPTTEEFVSQNISISPNAFNTYINVKAEKKINNIKIYDLKGSLMLGKGNIGNNIAEIAVGKLIQGMYIIKISLEDESVYTEKIVKGE